MKIIDITRQIEAVAPLMLQESYDNAGLLIGKPDDKIDKALITLDVTEAVLEEAIQENCQLIIAHHPIIFKGLKKLNAKTDVERIVMKAIKNDIAIYAAHTNLDNVGNGVNKKISDLIGLTETRILETSGNLLRKLVVFVPLAEAEKLRVAVFEAGGGHIGNYDSCSFNVPGQGSFRAGQGAQPFVGEKGKLHFEEEVRFETIYPVYKEQGIINAMLAVHPYEEVAYDIYPLSNQFDGVGAGMIGNLKEPETVEDFIARIKKIFNAQSVKYAGKDAAKVQRVAVCGGAGSFLISAAQKAGADVFISGDIKYHDFFLANDKLGLIDIGHYESEQFTKQLIFTILMQKFPNFALRISETNTNPVKYL
jgi:dinuclear metal center YbgI/SA1388 family protein